MPALSIEMTDRQPVIDWEALDPKRAEFPLTPDDVRAVRTPEMKRLADDIRALEKKAWGALQTGKPDDYWLYSETANILFEHLKVMACINFVEAHDERL
ncbi:MAG: hypothetical protein WHV44_03660 [Anaerolineales bacterium]